MKLKIVLAMVIFLLALIGIRFLLGGDEDTWICENGNWVKHGSPNSPMPTDPCGQ